VAREDGEVYSGCVLRGLVIERGCGYRIREIEVSLQGA
jgi:hypothetical protein